MMSKYLSGIYCIIFIYFWLCCEGCENDVLDHDPKWNKTTRAIGLFEDLIFTMCISYEQTPKASYKDTIEMMKQHPKCKDEMSMFSSYAELILRGTDSWGRPFFYKKNESDHTVIIRSFGKNGYDENGNGDDIQKIIKYSDRL